jgi:peptide/nickel transport system permease protein
MARGRHAIGFALRRLAALASVLVAISLVVFSLLTLAPGSTEQVLIGARPSTPELRAALREEYGLDKPFLAQYAAWASRAVRLDFGTSLRTGEPVRRGLAERAGTTTLLAVYAFLLALACGIPLGVLAARRRGRTLDRVIVGTSVLGVSAPAFATGLLLIYVFSARLDWFPPFGEGAGFVDQLWHLTLPAVALAFTSIALIVKLTRAAMIDALERDYVTFGLARGISRRRVLVAYAFRNALIPVITAGGLVLAFLLTGAVLVETTFQIRGLGSWLVDSVSFQDLPAVQGLALLTATIIVLVNLVVDLLYMVVDPRIRLGAGR